MSEGGKHLRMHGHHGDRMLMFQFILLCTWRNYRVWTNGEGWDRDFRSSLPTKLDQNKTARWYIAPDGSTAGNAKYSTTLWGGAWIFMEVLLSQWASFLYYYCNVFRDLLGWAGTFMEVHSRRGFIHWLIVLAGSGCVSPAARHKLVSSLLMCQPSSFI